MVKPVALVSLGLVGAVVAVIPASSAGASKEPVNRPACLAHVVRDESANGSSVCVAAHSDVTIMLKAAAGSSWSEPAATGHVLGPPLGLPTPFGLVGWSFRTNTAGRAEIKAVGRSCSPAGPCHDMVYRLSVTVR